MGLREGTNNYAELITLRHLLHFYLSHECNNLQIFGDSKIMINWFNNITICHAHTLRNILDEVNIFKAHFNSIICHHIFKKHNNNADRISKEAMLLPRGQWMIQEQRGTPHYQYYHRPYIDQAYHRVDGP